MSDNLARVLGVLGALGAGYTLSESVKLKSDVKNLKKISSYEEASYIVFTDGDKYYAKNGDSGTIEFVDSDFSNLLQNVINTLYSRYRSGKVFIKKGSYQISQILINNMSNIMLEFEEGAILNVVDAPNLTTFPTDEFTLMPVIGVINSNRIYIKGGAIIDTGAYRGSYIQRDGILIKNSQHVVIEGVTIKNTAGCGIRLNGAGTYDFSNPDNSNLMTKHVIIVDCHIENTKTYVSDSTYYVKGFGIEIEYSEDVYVTRCRMYNNNESSFRTHASRKVVFIANYVYNQQLGDPFDIWGSDNIVIAFNKVVALPNGPVLEGVFIYLYCRNIYVISNDFQLPTGQSIRLYDVTGNIIENVWILYNRAPGNIGLVNKNMKNIYIIGNDIGTQLYVSPSEKGVVRNIVIEGNVFRNASINNIYIKNAESVIIRHNYFVSNIIVVTTDKVIIENNVFDEPSDTTYRIAISIRGSVKHALIKNNYIYNTTYQGINILTESGYSTNEIVEIIGNVFDNCSTACPSCPIVQASNDAVSLVRIIGNIFINSRGNRSVYIGSNVSAEIFDNTVDKPIDVVGTAVVKRNRGYRTENSDVATISANSTRVTVSHGLATTPTKILITPLGQPPGKLWVENITSTSFDIVTDTAPTADLNVSWYAEV